MRAIRCRRSGQALVEFALVAGLLLILVLGLFDFARALQAYQTVTDAAREAARTAVVANGTYTQDTVRHRVNMALIINGLDSTRDTTFIAGWRTGQGQPTTVSIKYPYFFSWLQPLIGWTNAQALIWLKTQHTMRQE